MASCPPTPPLVTRPLPNDITYGRILADFPSVTQVSFSDRPIKHKVTHHITTTGPPVCARTRRLAPERLQIARQEFDHMLELDNPTILQQLVLASPHGPQENTR